MSVANPTSTLDIDPYESRVGSEWAAQPRRDPVVWGAADGPLAQPDVAKYSDQGFLAVPQLLSPEEAAETLAEANALAQSADVSAPDVIAEPNSHIVRSLFRLHRTNDRIRELVKDPRLADVARQLLGSEVYVHQCRINFKPAFRGKEFFWHSDFETWHVEDGMPRMRAVSLSISLTENNEFNGPLMVVRGSHELYIQCVGRTPDNHFEQSLRKQEYGVPSVEALQFLVEQGEIVAPKGGPGSALFFECNTMHGSVGNLSPYPRTNLFIVYNSVENGLVDPFGGLPPRPDFLAEREIIPVSDL